MTAAILGAVIVWTGNASAVTTTSPCLNLTDLRLEVCTAYVVNATLECRVPYYKLGRSTNAARARAVRFRFESRYVGPARTRIEKQVGTWPSGTTEVGVPSITIRTVTVDQAKNRAVLITRESWLISTKGGRTLFSEQNRNHRIALLRVEGLVLHKWVVRAIS